MRQSNFPSSAKPVYVSKETQKDPRVVDHEQAGKWEGCASYQLKLAEALFLLQVMTAFFLLTNKQTARKERICFG